MPSAHLRHRDRHRIIDLGRARPRPVGPVRQPGHTLSEITLQPGMHTHPRHPDRRRDLRDRRASQDRPDRVQPLLHLRQDNQRHPGLPGHGAHERRAQDQPTNGQVLSISDTELSSITRYRTAWVRSRRLRISILAQGPRCARPPAAPRVLAALRAATPPTQKMIPEGGKRDRSMINTTWLSRWEGAAARH